MLEFHALKIPTVPLRTHSYFFNSALRLQRRHTVRSQQQPTFLGFNDGVFVIWMKRERPVVGKSPWRSCPNDGAHAAQPGELALSAIRHSKFRPDRGARVILIFDLSFSQCRRIVNAPIDRLSSAIGVTFLHEIAKSTSDNGLVLVVHREIRSIPTSQHSQTLKIPLMLLHIARSKLPAKPSKLGR